MKSYYALEKYINYKNKLTGLIRSAEKLYYENRFTYMKYNIKGTWNLIKTIINNTGTLTASSCVDELLINHKISKDKSLIANKFDEYFTNIGSGLASKIPYVPGDFRKYINNGLSVCQGVFFLPNLQIPLGLVILLNSSNLINLQAVMIFNPVL